MLRIFKQALSILSRPWVFALFLLAVCAAAYAPLITRLGFYWDDFPINWIAATMGDSGLERYFSTNRPVWGMVYRATTPLLGSAPLTWQIFGLLMRWISGLALWALLRLVWRERGQLRRLGSGAVCLISRLQPAVHRLYVQPLFYCVDQPAAFTGCS